jgi:hypothetical protein
MTLIYNILNPNDTDDISGNVASANLYNLLKRSDATLQTGEPGLGKSFAKGSRIQLVKDAFSIVDQPDDKGTVKVKDINALDTLASAFATGKKNGIKNPNQKKRAICLALLIVNNNTPSNVCDRAIAELEEIYKHDGFKKEGKRTEVLASLGTRKASKAVTTTVPLVEQLTHVSERKPASSSESTESQDDGSPINSSQGESGEEPVRRDSVYNINITTGVGPEGKLDEKEHSDTTIVNNTGESLVVHTTSVPSASTTSTTPPVISAANGSPSFSSLLNSRKGSGASVSRLPLSSDSRTSSISASSAIPSVATSSTPAAAAAASTAASSATVSSPTPSKAATVPLSSPVTSTSSMTKTDAGLSSSTALPSSSSSTTAKPSLASGTTASSQPPTASVSPSSVLSSMLSNTTSPASSSAASSTHSSTAAKQKKAEEKVTIVPPATPKFSTVEEIIASPAIKNFLDALEFKKADNIKSTKAAQERYFTNKISLFTEDQLLALNKHLELVQHGKKIDARFDTIRKERKFFGQGNTATWQHIRHAVKEQLLTLATAKYGVSKPNEVRRISAAVYNADYGMYNQHTGHFWSHIGKTNSAKKYESMFTPEPAMPASLKKT